METCELYSVNSFGKIKANKRVEMLNSTIKEK